jgi:NAD(P)H-hydrate epimerase
MSTQVPKTLSRQQSRELDSRATDQFGIPSIVLMENAGRGVTDWLVKLQAATPVVVCCGRGNNAGDGFVIARHLDLRGIQPRVLLWATPNDLRGDARTNFEILTRCGVSIEVLGDRADREPLRRHISGATWIVDALLGTGARGSPRPPLDGVIEEINSQSAPILAVDVPSGLDCDTGTAAGAAVRARHTCTFVAQKPGFLVPGADHYTGEVHVLDIGAPRCLVDEMLDAGK